MRLRRLTLGVVTALGAACLLAACGGSSGSSITAPKIAPAQQFTLGGFEPAGPVLPGHPTTISFTVKMPDGKALTQYKTGAGPHTGVHLIIVRKDLAYIIHQHPPVGANGQLKQTVTFPAPGTYRILVDVYPNVAGLGPNFQLYTTVDVKGKWKPKSLPAFRADQTVDGYHIDMSGHPKIKAIQAQFIDVKVTNPKGQKVTFVPWFGALAHAIFFQKGSLEYFHSHICAPNAPNCGALSGVAASRVTGKSSAPGNLSLGVLLPTPGTWRLFLQMKLGGHVITAPYTLNVAS